ncbi:MAG: VWA domain-containing protein [Bacilli bacterium]|nr:VWA domain-containing protein [Bacilli bacterium]
MMDRIAKEKLNIILLIDASKSMQGARIKQVNQAILDIQDYLKDLQVENTNMDFYITIIPFSNEASFYDNKESISIDDFKFDGIKCGGYTNLHLAYVKLGDIMKKESKGGIMPDFGGAAPIILLLTDGHPTGNAYKEKLLDIIDIPWFKAALRYGIAVELNDDRTMQVLQDFVGNNGDVINCYDSSMLKNIIKIIVVTASKVKSSNTNIANGPHITQNQMAQQLIAEELSDTEAWEW